MELNYIHMAVRLATCNILKLNYSSWSRDWIRMIAVNEVDMHQVEVTGKPESCDKRPQANKIYVTGTDLMLSRSKTCGQTDTGKALFMTSAF